MPFEFPAEHTLKRRASEARRSHLRITSLHRNLYLLSARPLRSNAASGSTLTVLHTITPTPAPISAFVVSHRRISPVTRSEMVVQGPMNLATKCCRHLSFSTSCRLPPKYAGHMLYSSCFASNNQSYVHAAFVFLVVRCLSHVHFFPLSQRQERVYKYILYYII